MAWRLARSLVTLRREVRDAYPHRDTRSDGTIGDARHRNSPSKHNPGPDGIVEAVDLDEDTDGTDDEAGQELWALCQHIVRLGREGHPALGAGAHVIYEGRIWSANRGWQERPYTGVNAHRRHLHVAVEDGPGKDSTQSWRVRDVLRPARKPDRWLGLTSPHMRGQDVKNAQHALNAAGARAGAEDGIYGRGTAEAVARFQAARKINERGVGPQTWAALRKVVHG